MYGNRDGISVYPMYKISELKPEYRKDQEIMFPPQLAILMQLNGVFVYCVPTSDLPGLSQIQRIMLELSNLDLYRPSKILAVFEGANSKVHEFVINLSQQYSYDPEYIFNKVKEEILLS
jgi:hypothetical protein